MTETPSDGGAAERLRPRRDLGAVRILEPDEEIDDLLRSESSLVDDKPPLDTIHVRGSRGDIGNPRPESRADLVRNTRSQLRSLRIAEAEGLRQGVIGRFGPTWTMSETRERVEGGAQRRKKADEAAQTKCGGSDERGCPRAPVRWMAFPRAADRGCVYGLVLRRAAQPPYRIGRLSRCAS